MPTASARKKATKSVLDRAIQEAYRAAGWRSRTGRAFDRLLRHVRLRSDLLRPAPDGGRDDAPDCTRVVAGLLALATHHRDWFRPVDTWAPLGGNPRPLFATLARHLLAAYPVPAFLDVVWLKGEDDDARRQQGWFKHVGAGRNIRTADLPLKYTKMMAHQWLQAPAHHTVEAALRWGQVRGLGGSRELALAVADTRLGGSFEHEDFWLTVVQVLVNHPEIDVARVGPIVEYLHHQRFVPREFLIEEGDLVELGPEQPNLSMKGRSPASLLRQVTAWQAMPREPKRIKQLSWARSNIGEFRHVEAEGPGSGFRCWTVRELLSSSELYREGEAMRHCVGSYVQECALGETTIWSMCFETLTRRDRVMTIEVDPDTRRVWQAKRRGNAPPNAKVRAVLERWARQEGLEIPRWI
jgi:hypothetical protein